MKLPTLAELPTWVAETYTGNIVSAIVFFPIGLLWWSPTVDLWWTLGGTAVSLVSLKVVKHNRSKSK